jgi:hypothetical protein
MDNMVGTVKVELLENMPDGYTPMEFFWILKTEKVFGRFWDEEVDGLFSTFKTTMERESLQQICFEKTPPNILRVWYDNKIIYSDD